QQRAFAAAQLQDRLLWPQLSRGHEGLKTCRAVLQAALLEETTPLTSKAAMPVFQVHVCGAHQAVLSPNKGSCAPEAAARALRPVFISVGKSSLPLSAWVVVPDCLPASREAWFFPRRAGRLTTQRTGAPPP